MPYDFHERRNEPPLLVRDVPVLPAWLARLVLYPGEKVQMVRGPRISPSLEPYLTHPALFLVAIPPAALALAIGRVLVDSWQQLHPAFMLVAMAFLIGTIMVLAASAGHFTRLVATDRRLLIIQGRQLLRSRDIDDLPPSLVRRTRGEDGKELPPTLDIGAVNQMLGGQEGGFVSADAILKLGKKIDQLRRRREEDR